MKKKNSRGLFFVKLFVVLATIVAIVFGAYFALDKLVVPKYFKDYGINNMHDLVAMMTTLYNSPDEEDIITNGYTRAEQKKGVNKLIEIGFPTDNTGELDYFEIANGVDEGKFVAGEYGFTDREIASLLDLMLSEGVLASKLPNLNYIDTIKINVLELIIEPTEIDDGNGNITYANDSAKVSFTFKFDTSSVRTQMATAMNTPMFLLDMIVPETMYITVDYNIEKNELGDWVSSDSFIGINGRTAKDSEILLNLLIDFIFPPEDEMTLEKFSSECGNILIQGMELLGSNVEVRTNVEGKSNGIVLTI